MSKTRPTSTIDIETVDAPGEVRVTWSPNNKYADIEFYFGVSEWKAAAKVRLFLDEKDRTLFAEQLREIIAAIETENNFEPSDD